MSDLQMGWNVVIVDDTPGNEHGIAFGTEGTIIGLPNAEFDTYIIEYNHPCHGWTSDALRREEIAPV
jgi:hypothetical protein